MTLKSLIADRAPTRLRPRVIAYTAAIGWIWVTITVPTGVPLAIAVAWLAAPGIAALAVSKAARHKWWRWPIVWSLFAAAYTSYAPAILALGSAWAISEAWITAHPTDTTEIEPDNAGRAERAETNRIRRRLARSGNPAKAAAAEGPR